MKNLNELKKILKPERVLCSRAECIAYSRDMSAYSAIPDVVVLPVSAKDVQKVLIFASENMIPVTPRGAGTSVTGAVIPVYGGIVMDLSLMKRIKEINIIDRFAVVEPGVICSELNSSLPPEYFFPPDPGSCNIATLGGMISTNASGRSALKYGTTGDYLMAVEAVLASGELIRAGHQTPKASAGFDITRLFSSAEGTIGVITEATLRIKQRPEAVSVCLAGFQSVDLAADVAVEIVSSNILPSSCELMDCVSIQEFSSKLGLKFNDTKGMLIIEIDGYPSAVSDKMNLIRKLCKKKGAKNIYSFDDPNARKRVWRFRHKLVSALSPLAPNSRLVPMAEDIGVPVSKVPEAIRKTRHLSMKHDLPIVLFGHAGDGNIHATFVINPLDRNQWERAKNLAAELNGLATELGGTVSSEHGVGIAKAAFIKQELGKSHEIMKKIKDIFDPSNIMNPGKLGFSEKKIDMFDNFAFNAAFNKKTKFSASNHESINKDSLLCMMCGSCRSVCPIFSATGRESNNARSNVQLLYALQTGAAELSFDIAKKFYLCTGCGICEQNCPSQIKVTKLVAYTRQQIYKKGFMPSEVKKITANIKKISNPFGINLKGESALTLLNHFPVKKEKNRLPDKKKPLIFFGCTASYLDRQIIFSLLNILDFAGIEYTTLGGSEICCGLPLAQAGDIEGFRQNAKKVTSLIKKKAEPGLLITPCPACLNTFCRLYREIADGLPFKAISTIEYLEQIIGSGSFDFQQKFEKKVIYHDPCYLSRHLNIIEEPRKILSRIPGISLLEFSSAREKSVCCGGGGLVPETFPKISDLMASKRVEQAIEKNSQIIVSACPACKRQLNRGRLKIPGGKEKIKVMDITEVILTALQKPGIIKKNNAEGKDLYPKAKILGLYDLKAPF